MKPAQKGTKTRSPDPRIARTRRAVLEGAAAIMVEKGVAAFTVDEVVEKTGVALSTIYRHWRSRDELLAAAIVFAAEPRSEPDTGSVRGDLLEFLSWRTRHLADNWDSHLQTLPGIIEAGRRNPHVGSAVTKVVGSVLMSLAKIISRGQSRGEIDEGHDTDALADILLGSIFIRGGYRDLQVTGEYVERLVDVLLNGIAHPPRSQR